MINLSSFAQQIGTSPVIVYGLGKSGLAAARALIAAGIATYAHDDDPDKQQAAITLGAKPLSPDFAEMGQAAMVILSPGIPLNFPEPHPVVSAAKEHNVKIIGDIELFALAETGCKTIGVTGTNGKSTTTALIAHILNAAGKKAIACGNIGNAIMDITVDKKTIVVIELSSFQLDLCPTFTPDIAVHLNITPDHIDRHGDLRNYIAIKERIFGGHGIGFCGMDDEASQAMFERAEHAGNRTMIPVSCIEALNDGLFLTGSDITDTYYEGGIIGSLSGFATLRGRHNHQNAMMAYGVARALDLDPDTIFNAMASYPGLPHRQLHVRTIHQVEYINDSKATNADATEKALITFNNIYWIVGGLPKAGGLQGLEDYASRIRHAYLIGSASDDFAKFMTSNKIPYTACGTLENAVEQAHLAAQKDVKAKQKPGTVLLSPACASYDQFKSYEHRGDVFTALVQKLVTAAAA